MSKLPYNNPFNIVQNPANHWHGLIKHNGRFCRFENVDYGVRAGVILLRNYIFKGFNTIEKIIPRFAPPNENYTTGYIHFICDKLDINMTEIITYPSDIFVKLCCSILLYESGKVYTPKYIYSIINKFNI